MKSLNFLNIIFFASLLSANVSFGQCYSAVSLDGANDYLSAAILDPETLYQKSSTDGKLFP